jgi:hypothetical protein
MDMKKMIFTVICAVMLLGTVTIGYADREDWRGGVRTRIQDAHKRIDRGVEQGSLTRQEEKSLRGELNGILRKIDRMKEDGHLSPKERDIINRDLDRLNKHITREKRDDDTRRRR